MTLSIIIVNYNVKKLLEQCLRSIENNNVELEVFVVDNASTDGSVEYLQNEFPAVRFIKNDFNVGFAKANNQVLADCTGSYILFLNPDTILPAGTLEFCVRFLSTHEDAGAVGVRMLDEQGNFLRESKRGLPTPAASFWKLAGAASLLPKSRIFSSYYMGHLDERCIHRVDVLSGAFMMIKKNVLQKTGGFDERFFMYAEDIDLSYRIQQAGFRNYYLGEITITHVKGASTKKDIRYVRQFYRAMSQYVRKHYGNGPFSWFMDAAIIVRGGIAAIMQLFQSGKKST